jgi:hypothetical protein
LVKNYFWRTIAVFVLPYLAVFLFILFVGILQELFFKGFEQKLIFVNAILVLAINIIVQVYLLIFFPALALVQLNDLKMRKEILPTPTKKGSLCYALLAIILVIFMALPVGTISFSKHFEKKVFQKTYLKATHGDLFAQNDLGYAYSMGIGTKRDFTEACKWYAVAADRGDAMAMENLGGCYFYGKAGEKNINKAIELYKKAADKNDRTAQFMLGTLYARGDGVPKNLDQATNLLTLSAKNYLQAKNLSAKELLVNTFVKFELAHQQNLPFQFDPSLPRSSLQELGNMIKNLEDEAS